LTDVVRDEHINRVLFYARRIRSLYFYSERTGPYSKLPINLLMNFIARINKLGAFYPLRKLFIQDAMSTTLFPISAPNLESIMLFTRTGPHEITSVFLQTIVAEAEDLTTFSLKGKFSGNISSDLPRFHHLQRLFINLVDTIIPMSFLRHIASSMTSLQSLNIYLYDCRFSHDLDNDRPTYSNTSFTQTSI